MDVYDFNNDGGGGTPLKYNPAVEEPKVPRQERNSDRDSGYNGQRNIIEQKNNEIKEQGTGPMMSSMSFSTPIEELDYSGGMENEHMAPVDSGAGVYQSQQQVVKKKRRDVDSDSETDSDDESIPDRRRRRHRRGGNPLGITNEQYEAVLLVLIVSVIFYPDVQAKLASQIPQFMNSDGSRSMVGLFVSGLLVAMFVWIARHFLIKAR